MNGFCRLLWRPNVFGTQGMWVRADGVTSFVDLRTVSASGLRGEYTEHKWCFVISDGEINDPSFVKIGDGHPLDDKSDPRAISAWKSITGIRPRGDRIADLLKWHLTIGADPSGLVSCPSLDPTPDSRLEVVCGSLHLSERFEFGRHEFTDGLRARLQVAFRELWEETNGHDHCLRVLDALCVKHRVQDWREFVPHRLREHVPGRLPFDTSVDDPFTHADVSPATNWTDVAGTSSIKSNTFCPTGSSTFGHFYHSTAMSSSDVEAYVTNSALPGTANLGACVRMSTSQQTSYGCWGLKTVTNQVAVYKSVNATPTELGFKTSGVAANGDVMLIGAQGSTIYGKQNGTQFYSGTDTAIGSGTRVGLECYNPNAASTACAQDDFHANDIVAVFTATAATTAGSMTCAASSTFAPKRTATSALVAQSMACSASSSFSQEVINSYSVKFGPNKYIDAGAIAQWNYTQPWAVWFQFKQLRIGTSEVDLPVWLTHASSAPYIFPLEIYPDQNQKIRVRMAHDFLAGNAIDIYGSTNICDGQPHICMVTYNGNGLASGFTIDLDGNAETITTVLNALSGSTVPSSNLLIGNQAGVLSNFYADNIARMRLYSTHTVRSQLLSYNDYGGDYPSTIFLSPYAAWDFDEGLGTTVHDDSGNGRNATAIDNSRWSRFRDQSSVKNRRKPRATPQQTTSGTSRTLSLSVLAGDLVVVKVATIGGSSITVSLADGGNTYQSDGGGYGTRTADGIRTSQWWLKAPADATLSIVVTASTTCEIQAFAERHSAPWPANPVASAGNNNGGSGTPSLGTASVGGLPGQLVMSIACEAANSTNPVQGDAFIYESRLNQSGMTAVAQQAYRDEDTTVDFDGTWSAAWAGNWAVFSPSQPTGTAACTAQPMTCAASASAFFTGPTRFGTMAVTAQSMTCAASAQRTVPSFTAAVACTARSMTCDARSGDAFFPTLTYYIQAAQCYAAGSIRAQGDNNA